MKLEPIVVSNCPVCSAFPVQHIAAPGDTDAYNFIAAINARDPEAHSLPTHAPEAQQLKWSDTLCNGERVNFKKAEKACAALGEGWRLPTRAELLSLVDDTRSDPAIDTARFNDTKSGAYWTGTPLASVSSFAWIVNFVNGNASGFHRDFSGAFVRAVRCVPAGQ
jgi:hypothetical protein